MTDRAQFEAMLEALINEDQTAAKEIFHNIVVARSREIYEELLAEDFEEEPTTETFGDDSEEDDESVPDDVGDEEGEDDADDDFGGDEEGEDDFGDDEEGDIEDRVMDLEDSLDALKSEFEQLMAGEEEEPEHDDMFGGEDDMGDMGDMDGQGDTEFGSEEPQNKMGGMGEMFREYTEKVAAPKHGDNGVNTKSIVAKPNNMGGTSANIARGGESSTGGTQGGLLKPTSTKQDGGNVNVPGGNAGKTAFKKTQPGHGPEKKGTGESADNKKSTIGSR